LHWQQSFCYKKGQRAQNKKWSVALSFLVMDGDRLSSHILITTINKAAYLFAIFFVLTGFTFISFWGFLKQ
jgi:hypothetical protein